METVNTEVLKVICESEDLKPFKGGIYEAGLDILSNQRVTIPKHGKAIVGTGLKIAIPKGNVGLLWSKSGLSGNHGIETGAGCIDETYRGEIKVVLYNHSDTDFTIERGNKITQLLIIPLTPYKLEFTDSLDDTYRGSNGFGSTGA